MSIRADPGPCPVCGAPHTGCTGKTGPIVVSQLPARDAAAAPELEKVPMVGAVETTSVTEQVQATLPPGQFTTGTYRGKKKR